ncbi:galactoside alpha-(1,2)-fucosyltransferase 1 [Nephila pilipes]|uniref:L-Fucosyltransferase n=1 Tax=Nephila pilipes TaxID=299642 RepID=A0A8X6MZA4_NEPPI|nr:galactoside alpha-(1,2)-fucosyltransferase 1 [Nephila pilipes]
MGVDVSHGIKTLLVVCAVCGVVFVFGYLPLLEDASVVRTIRPTPMGVPYLTIHTNEGRLGNQMFTFASLLGLAYLNNRRIALLPRNHKVLSEYFDMSFFPMVDERWFVHTQPWSIGNWLKEEDRSIPLETNIIKGNYYPTSFTFFHHVREEIREIFRFSDEIRGHVQEFLRQVKKVRPWTKVYVGIHVRRGDYIAHSPGGWLRDYNGREVDLEFFQKAVDYFKNKYSNVTFLAVSEDRDWCRKHLSQFGILTTPDSAGPAQDLSLLMECNHTIMTYGTYGFWGGFLSGGEVVYFTDFLKPDTNFAQNYFRYDKMYPPEWVGISTTKPGYWENYTNPFYS